MQLLDPLPVVDPGFPRRDAANLKEEGGWQYIIWPNFPQKNEIKMRKIGPRGRACPAVVTAVVTITFDMFLPTV